MKLYWDIQNHKLVRSTTSTQQIQRLDFILRDQVAVELYILEPKTDDSGYQEYSVPSGWAVKFAVKHKSALSGEALVAQGTWTFDTDHYDASITLNTSELIASHVAGKGTGITYDVLAELVLADVSGNNRDSTQVACRITEDVYRADDAEPTSSQGWPWLQEYTDTAGKQCLRFLNSDGEVVREDGPAGSTLIEA